MRLIHMFKGTKSSRQGFGVGIGFVVTLLAMVMLPGVAMGQSGGRDTSLDLGFGPSTSPNAMMSSQLVNLAKSLLASPVNASPTEPQLECAAMLFDLALKLNEDEPEYWRLRKDLAAALNDKPTQRLALSKYRKLAPEDDRAGLELVLLHLEGMQTLEDRLDEAERLLGLSKLEGPLRSRIALYAAQQALQRDDIERTTKNLKVALASDRANVGAAILALQLAIDQGQAPDSLRVGLLTMNLVTTRPDDAALRQQLAEIFLGQAAYEHAAKQYAAARQLVGRVLPDVDARGALALVASGEYADGLDLLSDIEAEIKLIADSQAAQRKAEGNEGEGEWLQEGLPFELELLRFIALDESGRKGEANGSFSRVVALLQDRVARGDSSAKGMLVWTRLFFGREDARAREMAGELGIDDPMLPRIQGYLALVGGGDGAAEGRAMLEDQVTRGDRFAEYVLAAQELKLNPPEGLTLMQDVIAAAPAELVSVLASLDLRRAEFTTVVTEAGRVMSRQARSWDGILTDPDPANRGWTLLRATVEPTRFRYLEPITVNLVLRNSTNLPLAMGPGGVLPSTVLIHPRPRRGGVVIPGIPPEVVHIDRKLTLPARGQVEVSVSLDDSHFGQLLASAPATQISFDIDAVYNPILGVTDRFAVGLGGAADSLFHLDRLALPVTEANVARWIADLHRPEPIERMRILARFGRLTANIAASDRIEISSLASQITAAINTAFPTLDPVSRAWFVKFLMVDDASAELFAPVLEDAASSDDTLVRLVYLVSQIDSADAAELATAEASGNETIAQFATTYRDVLTVRAEATKEAEAQAAAASAAAAAADEDGLGN